MKTRKNFIFKKKKFIYLKLVLLAGLGMINAQESSNILFSKGNDAYNKANYSQAAEFYEKIIKNGEHSSELYYNLGNAYYRLNQVAQSIYFFEKAKQLAPENQDIQINSSFAQNMTIDAIEPLPQSQLAQIKNTFFGLLSIDSWSKVTLVLLWSFSFLFLGYLFANTVSLKRSFFILSITSLIFFIASFGVTFSKDNIIKQEQYAILFSKQIDVWSEPNRQGDLLFILHEGTKVQVLDSLVEWQKIRIANGSEGWLRNAFLKNLN